jgi:(R,R)-butanediol dehydrogenase / meso-butanediol dehydrogenase / diacetyl reductase
VQAVRFYGKEDLRVEEVDAPTAGPGQVLLRPAFAGICGSDLHFYYYPEALPFSLEAPHPLTGAQLPQILGHEFSATVEAVGEGVEGWAAGDRAAVFPMAASCGECAACATGHPFACVLSGSIGATAPGGGMSQLVAVDAGLLHRLPEQVDLRMGALVEPMTVAWHAVARSGTVAGGTALVAGAGPIGIGAWFALRAAGVERILVSEPNPGRRAAIEALGATVVDPANDDLAAAVLALVGNDGLDVLIDAAGAGPALTTGLPLLRAGGRAVVVALHEHPVQLPLTGLMMAETEVVGAVGYTHAEFDAVIAAMADGLYDTTGWVQERELAEAEASIQELRSGTGAKVLLRVNAA